jgi:hypothetical protein
VGFVVDKSALVQVFSEYFGFPCQSFYRLHYTHHHPSSSGARIIGHLVATATVDLVPLHPMKQTKKKNSVEEDPESGLQHMTDENIINAATENETRN